MKVKNIRKKEPELTVDIEVEDTHSYQLSNGMVSHNTVSQLVDCSSGLHPRYSQYYIRRMRIAATDPLCKMLIDQGHPHHPEVGEDSKDPKTYVFEFPKKSPDTSVMNDEVNAMDQLEYGLMLKKYWCEHNPSCTIFVRDHEGLEVGAGVWKNGDYISGLTFLPYTGTIYKLAPYEEISEEEYSRLLEEMPEINFDSLPEYEMEDETEGAQEFACNGGQCEI